MPAVIRLATAYDADAIAAIYAPFCENTPVSFETLALAADEIAQRIRKITGRYPWLVLEKGSEITGYVYAGPHRERAAYQWSVEVTAYVRPQSHRRGVGRTLYSVLFQLLRRQGYYKAYAGITLPNPASVGLHQATGFEPVGVYDKVGYKLGAWHNVGWFQLTLQPEQLDPAPPLPVDAVIESPEWRQAISAGIAYYSKQQV